MTEGSILHADLDAFFASVEQRDDPSLRGRPVIVGSGVVMAASYEAKARGVRNAMGGRQALRLCPDAVVVPPRMGAYAQASKDVFAVFADTTPDVEKVSIDEAFLDVAGLRMIRGLPSAIATDLRREVRQRCGLAVSIGVARTKHLAKVASGAAKPDGLCVVPVEDEDAFLHPLPVERLWGVGDKTAEKLHAVRLHTVGQIAALEPADLVALLGRSAGRHVHALATHQDARRVHPGQRRRSMGAQHARAHTREPELLEPELLALVDTVTGRLRKSGLVTISVTVALRFGDFTRSTGARTLPAPTDDTATIAAASLALLRERDGQVRRRGVTLVGVTLGNLSDAPAQLFLPDSPQENGDLDRAVDAVREKFGRSSVRRASGAASAAIGPPKGTRPTPHLE